MVASHQEKHHFDSATFTESNNEESGRFYILIDGTPYRIHHILDLSVTGVKLLLEQPVPEQRPLTLAYQSDDLNISIQVEALWSAHDAESGLFQTEIKFDPLQADLSTLFFLAFRKQLDTFDNNTRLLQS